MASTVIWVGPSWPRRDLEQDLPNCGRKSCSLANALCFVPIGCVIEFRLCHSFEDNGQVQRANLARAAASTTSQVTPSSGFSE